MLQIHGFHAAYAPMRIGEKGMVVSMNLLSKFLPRIEFDSYADFKKNYKVNIPENFNFGYDVVDEYARLCPGKQALIHVDESDVITRYSFGDIKRLSDQCANMFASCGIGRGDVVMMMMKERVEAWLIIIALMKLGATVIPATYQLTPKDIIYRCECADVKMVCMAEDEEVIQHMRASRDACPGVRTIALVGDDVQARYGDEFMDFRAEMQAASVEFIRPTGENASCMDDTMLIYFSSGTTGMPKMIAHNFTYPLGHITTAKYWQQVEDDGVHFTMADSGWAKFGWGKIFGQWIAGSALVAFDTGRFHPDFLMRVIGEVRPTTFCAPPTIYRFLIKEDLSKGDFTSIHHCTTAGEPLNPEVFYRFKEATGLEIHEGFGQTETSVIIANFGWDPIKQGSTGLPSPLYDIDIVDEEGISCEDGTVGRIVVRNASAEHPVGLFTDYRKDAAAQEKAWRGGMYDTGDLAWRDSDGYLWFEGRGDDVIKCSGYRIGPFEVESALMTHPSVLECAVTAAPDPIRGQVVKATIVLAKGFAPSDELKKELQNHVKKVTAPYKYPRIVEFAAELPKTTSGKIRRTEIRARDAEKHKAE